MCVCAQRNNLTQSTRGSSFSTEKFSACGRVIIKARPQGFAAKITLMTYAPTNRDWAQRFWRIIEKSESARHKAVPANAYRSIGPDKALFSRFARIENPGPVAERDIDSFLAQSRTKLDRKFVQHGLDFLVGEMA